ncbi:MAG: NADH-quinone oxidoreductase subunit NuoN [Sphingopyxis sp.]|nr:NADH-quinone oxidoreductase subunit NuoN [Sphingopyxis sp.]
MNADLALVLPEILLTVGGLVTLMIATFASDRAVALYQGAAVLTLATAIAAVTATIGNAPATAFMGTVTVDAFGSFAKLLIYGASILCILIAPRFFGPGMRGEYPVLIVFAALGMGMMASARDMLTLYIGLELNSLAAYVLASFMRTDGRSAEAGLKYFVLGALASGMLLYGISLLYGFSGTTSFDGVAGAFASGTNMGLILGLVFVLAGMAFKISAVPFHMWTPDVYEGAPTPVTAFFASAPKVAAMALTTRLVVEAMGPGIAAWQQIIIFLALASILLGAVGAIGQTNVKRLLAYSSINNIGFMLIGLAAGTPAGVQAVLTYLLVYVVTTLGAFLVVLNLRDSDGQPVEEISALAGLSERKAGLAAALAVFLFSIAGIPPLFGFWPKYLVFEAAVLADLVPLAVVGIVASVISAFYYLAIIKTMYFDDVADVQWGGQGPWLERGLITGSALWLSVVGYLFIQPLAGATAHAAAVLF